jgi:hypothetical protein
VQFDRYNKVWDGLDSAITEMAHVAANLRKVSREHVVCVANVAANVDSRYVHMAVMTRACGKMDGVAEKLKNVANSLVNVLAGPSPPHEMQEEYISWNLDDSGWVLGLGLGVVDEVVSMMNLCFYVCCVDDELVATMNRSMKLMYDMIM